MSLELPEEVRDYLPHIVGDLRGGGLTIDIISYQPLKYGVAVNMFITW